MFSLRSFCILHIIILNQSRTHLVRDNEFPGDYTGEVTPDPFPNSEAKLVGPMVVLRGESRYRQEL